MEIYPERIRLGDVLIVKVTAHNRGEDPVGLPSVYDPTLSYLRVEIGDPNAQYRYTWRGHGHGLGKIPLTPLAPGDRRVVVFEAIEFPSVTELDRDFWEDMANDGRPAEVVVRMSHPDGKSFVKQDVVYTILERNAPETVALKGLYAEDAPIQGSYVGPQPAHFGVSSFPSHMATAENLEELEGQLEGGTLRDIIRATRLMRIVTSLEETRGHSNAERRAAAQHLLALLDQSEGLHREWLALNIFKWFYSHRTGPGIVPDMVEWDFVEDITERLPERMVDEVVGHALGGLQYWPFLEWPQEQSGFVPKLEIDDWRHQLYDPLFTRAQLTNHTEESVRVGSSVFHNASYWLTEGRFRYQCPSERRYLRHVGAQTFQAGESRFVDYEVLQMPPVTMVGHSFWNDLPNQTAFIETKVSLSLGEEKRKAEPRGKRGLAFLPRPEPEMKFLERLYKKLGEREPETGSGWYGDREAERTTPTPQTFGLSGFGRHEDLIQQLLDYEKNLSPGSLRDIVHLTKLMRRMSSESDQAEQIAAVDQVLHFLDTLPAVERETLLIRIIDWCEPLPSNAAYFRLADGALKRLPEPIFQYDDYPAARRRELGTENPGFLEYVRRHIGKDYRAEPESDAEKIRNAGPFGEADSRGTDPFSSG